MRVRPVAAMLLATSSIVWQDSIPFGLTQQVSGSAPSVGVAQTTGHNIQVSPDYVIGPGDILRISVWQEPQFGETVEVRPDGKISLPLISDIQVSGLTPNAAQVRLTSKLEGFVKHPVVSIVVAEVRSKTVYVVGRVERPGPFPLVRPITVEQLIAQAGGTTRHANLKHVYVLRQGSSSRIPVNFKKVLAGNRKAERQNVQLEPGDTVVVP